ncbi:MAG: L-2-amino-thiazoline-4-carboxylic acid hydrolase [Huintestinicola sp.]|uniref:L-2-amino-thiazoline-4-carboxylic acid hydrolase n=1 Tax=Huintestinicola sp. TaxID=2981661 RepID=UPI003EFD4EBC
MKNNNEILEALLEESIKIFPEHYARIEEKARTLYLEFSNREEGKPKEITMHTVRQIYPCIAFYKAVIDQTGQQETAYNIIDGYFKKRAGASAKFLQKILKIPFVYNIVPNIMTVVIRKIFGRKSGFEMTEHKTEGKVCHIDMLICPYYSACSACGCAELTVAFCNSDDVAYGNLHPKLSWERRKTLGRGDDCCDFILRVK